MHQTQKSSSRSSPHQTSNVSSMPGHQKKVLSTSLIARSILFKIFGLPFIMDNTNLLNLLKILFVLEF